MATKILPNETEINGRWSVDGKRVKADATAQRINDLIGGYLIEIARSDDGWSVLYKDPSDGRYWELTYPDSTSHGGGAPRLLVVSTDEAKARYRK